MTRHRTRERTAIHLLSEVCIEIKRKCHMTVILLSDQDVPSTANTTSLDKCIVEQFLLPSGKSVEKPWKAQENSFSSIERITSFRDRSAYGGSKSPHPCCPSVLTKLPLHVKWPYDARYTYYRIKNWGLGNLRHSSGRPRMRSLGRTSEASAGSLWLP